MSVRAGVGGCSACLALRSEAESAERVRDRRSFAVGASVCACVPAGVTRPDLRSEHRLTSSVLWQSGGRRRRVFLFRRRRQSKRTLHFALDCQPAAGGSVPPVPPQDDLGQGA